MKQFSIYQLRQMGKDISERRYRQGQVKEVQTSKQTLEYLI
jgi:hypothetical protein